MKHILALFLFSISLSACGGLSKGDGNSGGKPFQSKTLFTHSLRQKIEETADIKKVQFYTTRAIKMKRASSSEELEVTTDGKVVLKEGDRKEKVELERNLPGVCIAAYEDRLQISFSEGTYLIFRKDFSGTYSLLVERDIRGIAKIQYGTETYELQAGSDEAKLAIDKQFKNEDENDERNESGRRIGGGL
ncbi:MAG: hypothetical protein AAF849_16435 [Bacteroidota bacterium]